MIRGNHDLWWQGIGKLNALHPDMHFLQNEHIFLSGGIAVCGSRGWGLPGLEYYGADDEKILARELIRLKMALDKAVSSGAQEIICAMHFPPALTPSNSSPFTELIQNYPVTQVVYGHLHGPQAYRKGIQGDHAGIRYNLVTCDFLNFKPLRII